MYLNQKGRLCTKYCITKRVLANSTYYMLGAYVTRSILQRPEEKTSFNELPQKKSRISFATHGHLLDQASCRQSDQFSSSCQGKILVSSTYSCVGDFFNSDQTGFARYKQLLNFQEEVGPLTAIVRIMVLYYSTKYFCFRFQYKCLPLPARC